MKDWISKLIEIENKEEQEAPQDIQDEQDKDNI